MCINSVEMISDPITTIEAAAILGLDASAIRHRIGTGTLKSEKRGRDHLVSRGVIERELAAKVGAAKKNGKKGGRPSKSNSKGKGKK